MGLAHDDVSAITGPVTPSRGVAEGKELIALLIGLMATTSIGMDLMIPAFPDIRREFGMRADSSGTGWIITSYFLGLAVGPLLYGATSDRYGRRKPIVFGLALCGVGSLIAVLAPAFGWIVVGRFVWGVGAAGPRSLTLAVVRDRYHGEVMARLMSVIVGVFLIVPIVAPSVGAGLVAIAPWRIVFWVPLGLITLLALWAATRLPETLPRERRRPFTVRSVADATRRVGSQRDVVCYILAATLMLGVMTANLSSTELVLEDVYAHGELFPLVFGAMATLMACMTFLNGRLVGRLGLTRLLRRMSATAAVVALVLAATVIAGDGAPSIWLFAGCLILALAVSQGLGPTVNSAAMLPLADVAGMAAAIINTVSFAGAALLGSIAAGAFDGTARPFAVHVAASVGCATLLIFVGTSWRRRHDAVGQR